VGRFSTNCLPTRTGYGAAGRLLVASTVVMALGLGAVMASPVSFPNDRGDVAQLRPPMVIDGGDARCPDPSPEDQARPVTMLRRLAGELPDRCDFLWGTAIMSHGEEGRYPGSASGSLVRIPCADCDAASPVWDPVQDDLAQDRRAFLRDTAIQVHAPASAPAPRRSPPPHPHGVD
jgi:hypothetical protein